MDKHKVHLSLCMHSWISLNLCLSSTFLLIHLDFCAHTSSQPLSLPVLQPKGETKLHTFFTVSSMIIFPTGMRMPPSTASTAPSTAPNFSPHNTLQQPMVICTSLSPNVRLSACLPSCLPPRLPACLPGSLFSFCLCVCGVCVCVLVCAARQCLCPSSSSSTGSTGRLYHQRSW